MKVVICEDEKAFSDQLAGYIKEWAAEKGVLVDIFKYTTAEEFLYEWQDGEDYDIIFLDIIMGYIDGMELAEKIRETNTDIPIVFVTNIKEYRYAADGYEVSAMRYLEKPVQKEKIFYCLDQVNQADRIKKYFLLKDAERTFRIPHEDIIYISVYSHTATAVTASKRYEFRKTTSQILEELDDALFVKCHKAYIINIRRVESVSKTCAIMSNGDEIPISKNIAWEIYDMFHKYNTNKL
ncbi:MAG: LytTR family DNA-binding domain-containing protein [Oscillospiraceae bacterium]|nr:LytTR family DNA-binding domain-containing protein [Oscillospiraceae bacterium]